MSIQRKAPPQPQAPDAKKYKGGEKDIGYQKDFKNYQQELSDWNSKYGKKEEEKKEPGKDAEKKPLEAPKKPNVKDYKTNADFQKAAQKYEQALKEYEAAKKEADEKAKKEAAQKKKAPKKPTKPTISKATQAKKGDSVEKTIQKAKGITNRTGRMHPKFAKYAMNVHRGDKGGVTGTPIEELTFAEMFTNKFKNKFNKS
tara:strand:- start:6 stop:605 length:600 start_codon:yes stop_codon:yes gene_type:complete